MYSSQARTKLFKIFEYFSFMVNIWKQFQVINLKSKGFYFLVKRNNRRNSGTIAELPSNLCDKHWGLQGWWKHGYLWRRVCSSPPQCQKLSDANSERSVDILPKHSLQKLHLLLILCRSLGTRHENWLKVYSVALSGVLSASLEVFGILGTSCSG